MNRLHQLAFAVLPLCVSMLASAQQHVHSVTSADLRDHSGARRRVSSPLVEKVRRATARFKDVNVALAEGWMPGTPCVSGPNEGAMGIHYVLPARLGDAVLDAEQPEALIYEPLPGGRLRLVGVEFIVFAEAWDGAHEGPAVLDGHLLNLVGAPNRYGLGAFYELHVWAWQSNTNGHFADWNPDVTCDLQAAE